MLDLLKSVGSLEVLGVFTFMNVYLKHPIVIVKSMVTDERDSYRWDMNPVPEE